MSPKPIKSTYQKPIDPYWWLPIPLFFILPIGLILFPSMLNWIFPPPPRADSGEIDQILCWPIFFIITIPGKLVITCILTTPAIILLFKRDGLKKGLALFLMVAYGTSAVVGLIGTIKFIGYQLYDSGAITMRSGLPHLAGISPDAAFSLILLAIAAIAPGLAIITLMLGWYKKKLLLRSVITPIASSFFLIFICYAIIPLGGLGNACTASVIFTAP